MLPILFQNQDVVAIAKPEGIASIPEAPGQAASLLERLAPAFEGKLYVVHRLDKEVSGVMLFARNAAAHRHLNDQFERAAVRKTYLALAHGVIREDGGTIDKPLRQFGSGRMGVDLQHGKPCQTVFEVVERFASCTLVRVHPLSGRRHQIRAHFYSIGHPIVGDLRYGDRQTQRAYPRLMLHAQAIAFRLVTGEEIVVEAPLPESFQAVLERVRRTGKSRADAPPRRG